MIHTRKVPVKTAILTFFCIILLGAILLLALRHHRRIGAAKSLLPGESIEYMDLLDINDQEITSEMLKGKVVAICILSSPCAKCSKNLSPWQTMADYFGDRVAFIGIISDGDPDAFRHADEGKLNFPLYIPRNSKKLRNQFRLKTGDAQTLVVQNNEVKFVLVGDLDSKGHQTIIQKTRELILN